MHPIPIKPGPGQESVWDYPRPPRLEPVTKHIQIKFNGAVIADTRRTIRVLETSHPPVYYIPPEDIRREYLREGQGRSFCEWKGEAHYVTLEVDGKRVENVGWTYANPTQEFRNIKGYIAFYAGPMDACLVDGEKARPQPGSFYGGWITDEITGPFKGESGSMGW
jgi:uncharacterized protein (DUF427 family)